MARIKKLLIACAIVILFVGSGIYFDAKSNGPRKVQLAEDSNLIPLSAVTINVKSPAFKNLQGAALTQDGGYYLVHFKSDLDKNTADAFIATVGQNNAEVITSNTYLCQLYNNQMTALGSVEGVDWIGEWKPEYKISPDIAMNVKNLATSASVPMSDGAPSPKFNEVKQPDDQFIITFFKNTPTSVAVLAVTSREGTVYSYSELTGRMTVKIDKSKIADLAAIDSVYFIERKYIMTTENDNDTWIVQTNILNDRKIFDNNITGSGQIVGISDSGIDMDHLMFWDSTTGLPDHTLNNARRKVISYYNWYQTGVKGGDGHYAPGDGYYPLVGDPMYNVYDWDILQGHGSHTSGTIAGEWPTGATLPTWTPLLGIVPTAGYDFYEGNAFGAKLILQDLGRDDEPAVYPPPDLNDPTPPGIVNGVPFPGTVPLFPQAMADGAFIHSNSWGGGTFQYYDSYSLDVDQMMWTNKNFLAIFSMGNSGPGIGTIEPPATAKDCLSIGAAETSNDGYGHDSENVADFSSHGPGRVGSTGRVKPDVTAPGYYLFSAENDNVTNGTNPNDGLVGYAGTSMAAPTVAGAAALVRQYYMGAHYNPVASQTGFQGAGAFTPSAAMMKATIINSAQPMTGANTGGTIPGHGQGWGRMLLDNALYFSGDTRSLLIDDDTYGLDAPTPATGECNTYTVTVGPDEPLDVTMAYTDPPGTIGSTASNVRNLLYVEVDHPNGSDYYLSGYGNFANGESVPDTVYVYSDPVQKVRINNPTPGKYTIWACAFQTNQTTPGWNRQPYALAVSGNLVQHQGYVQFDSEFYSPPGTATMTLTDADLAGNGTQNVTVTSASTGDTETATLNESGSTGIFTGGITFSVGTANSGNNNLEVATSDTLTVSYTDASPTGVRTDTAIIDLDPPVISNVVASMCNDQSVAITWHTNEPATSVVNWGTTTAYGNTVSKTALVEDHYIEFDGLARDITYYYEVCSTDQAGNTACSGPYDFSFTNPLMLSPQRYHVGYVAETDYGVVLDDDDMWTGHNTSYAGWRHGVFQFDLTNLPPEAVITSAIVNVWKEEDQIDSTQADIFSCNLIQFTGDLYMNATIDNVHNAPILTTLKTWTSADLGDDPPGTSYVLTASNISAFNPDGKRADYLTFRFDGPTTGDSIFSWDTGFRQDIGSLSVCHKPLLILTLKGPPKNAPNTQIDDQMRPTAVNHIAEGNSLLAVANDLISQAKAKGKDASACETLVGEAKELLLKARTSLDNSIYANNLALQALAKLNQAIDCLKVLG
jgi:subtilisin family serine protease